MLHGTLVVVACELDRVLTCFCGGDGYKARALSNRVSAAFFQCCLVSRGPLLCASGTAPLHDARLPSAHDSVGRLSETVSKDAGLSRRLGRVQRSLARRS